MEPITILCTNDDGIDSPGLQTLVKRIESDTELNCNVYLVAPKHPQSAKGCSHAHGNEWIKWERRNDQNRPTYAVEGTPATCTSFALRFLKIKPDIVISGINFGENVGSNLPYSGTLGAAWEAAHFGSLALATSLELPSEEHFQMRLTEEHFREAAEITVQIIKQLVDKKPTSKLWNLNIPRQATRSAPIVETAVAPQRWNRPEIAESKNNGGNEGLIRFDFVKTEHAMPETSDVVQLRKGKVTLSKIDGYFFPWRE